MKHIAVAALAASMPRAVFAMPRADVSDPIKLIGDIKTAFEAFKAENDKALSSKVDDVVLTEKVDRINADLTKLTKAYEEQAAALTAARVGGSGNDVSPEAAAHARVFNTWFRQGDRAAEAAMREADVANMRELEVKAELTTQSDPDGGYLVPTEMEGGIDRVLGTVSVMRQLARVISISGNEYKKLISMGGAGSGWVGEEDSRPETSTPTLREIVLTTGEIYANPAATQTLLDDARVDIARWLAEEVAIEFDEKEGAAFIAGDGVKKPRGFLSYPKVANGSYAWGKLGFVVSGDASAFPAASTTVSPADCLIAAYYALRAGYRGNAAWLMSDAVAETVRKFKDAEGAYVWAPPSGDAKVPTILQKPVYNDDNMEAVGAGKFPIAFGDFTRGYTIVDRMGVRVLRDPYTNKPFVHFYTTKRVGGGVTNFEAIKLLKIAAG